MESAGLRTSRTTVFKVPPLYVSLKIGHQFLRVNKNVYAFYVAEMPVVAFATFVVVAHDADALDDIGYAVLESVRYALDWNRQLPQNKRSERGLGIDNAFPNQKRSFHVGHITNISKCCQKLQQEAGTEG
jgi:hypothetical protein